MWLPGQSQTPDCHRGTSKPSLRSREALPLGERAPARPPSPGGPAAHGDPPAAGARTSGGRAGTGPTSPRAPPTSTPSVRPRGAGGLPANHPRCLGPRGHRDPSLLGLGSALAAGLRARAAGPRPGWRRPAPCTPTGRRTAARGRRSRDLPSPLMSKQRTPHSRRRPRAQRGAPRIQNKRRLGYELIGPGSFLPITYFAPTSCTHQWERNKTGEKAPWGSQHRSPAALETRCYVNPWASVCSHAK